MDDKKNSPAFTCKAYDDQQAEMQICKDLDQRTLHIRSLGTKYLPRESAEEAADYTVKKDRAIVHPGFVRTKLAVGGLILKNGITLGEDVPVVIRGVEDDTEANEGLQENIDNAGNCLDVFAKELLDKGIRDGHCFVLVDMPPALPEGSTKADELAAKRRPYWLIREKSQALNWRFETINGRERLAQITFKEISMEADGAFGEQEVIRYRVLRSGTWQIFKEIKNKKNETEIVLEDEGFSSLPEIPVSVFYANKEATLCSSPLLIELAHIVIAHYQAEADYRIYLHICSRPVLWERMGDKNQELQRLSAYEFIRGYDPSYAIGWAEVTGSALGAARTDLKDLEERMGLFGSSLLVTQSTERTATEVLTDNIAEKSPLQKAAESFQDCLEGALGFTAQYLNEKSGGSVSLGDLNKLTMSPEMARLIFDQMGSKITLETGFHWLKTGELPETFSPETEADAVRAEAKRMTSDALDAFNAGA